MKILTIDKTLGFSLIEVLIALTISSIGLLGLAALQLKSMKAESSTASRTQAIVIADDIANQIYLNEDNPSIFLTPAEGVSCSSVNSSSDVAATGIAKEVIWDTLCKDQAENGSISSGSKDLINPTLTISCDDAFDPNACNDRSKFQISLSWINIMNKNNSNNKGDSKFAFENAERLSYSLEIYP